MSLMGSKQRLQGQHLALVEGAYRTQEPSSRTVVARLADVTI